ncbi:MAG TPA: SdrD B-like domain-containing protein [Terriglobales bacterium]|nr:SdrD B-like domain-containing protein [Terriglobales bacterium]
MRAAWLLLAAISVCAVPTFASDSDLPSSVDVYWKSERSIAVPGVTSVIILDEKIATAQIGNDTIDFVGLERGETVALAYVNGNPVSIVVRVMDKPMFVIPPSLARRNAELAHGTYGSDFQNTTEAGNAAWVLVSSAQWSQQFGADRFEFSSQVEDDSQFGGHAANLRTGTIGYTTPHVQIQALDFTQSLTGANFDDRVDNFSNAALMEIRGADVTLNYGKNSYSFFAGTSVPYYYLSLSSTRDVAGFSFHRKQSGRLNLFGSTTYANIPTTQLISAPERRTYFTQTAGFRYLLRKNLALGSTLGASTRGKMLQGDASYTSFLWSGYLSALWASQNFALNQLQTMFSGSSSIKGGVTYRTTRRLSQGLYFEHTNITPGLIFRNPGSYDYLSPTFYYTFSPTEHFNFSYMHTSNTGGFTNGSRTGNRYDFTLNSQFTPRLDNSAEFTIGSLQDPLQINSQDEFTLRDTLAIPVWRQQLLLGVEEDRVHPSLVQQLNQELGLLSPDLQALFLANPVAFIDSPNFPPEVKALLSAEQPTGLTLSAAANLSLGRKLRLSPNMSATRSSSPPQPSSWTDTYGYSASYQLRPTFQLRSTLMNVLLWNGAQHNLQRTTVLSIGFQKNFAANPGALPILHRSRTIEGRVFQDSSVKGVYTDGERGLEGLQVRLENGEIATTDEQGRFKFSNVSADQHQVSLDLAQFKQPVRMTTRAEQDVDLIQQHVAIVNFGVLNSARVIGNVFNDLRFENQREPDSKGLATVQLLLDDGKQVRKVHTAGSGDFEWDNVQPGDYTLSIDPTTLPANYTAPKESFAIHVSPVQTVVQNIPVRALRSISGKVFVKVPITVASDSQDHAVLPENMKPSDGSSDENFVLKPLAGVQINADHKTVTSDADGSFLLRDLPAGDLTVTVVPFYQVPPNVKIPAGKVHMPTDPIQVEGAKIVISPELLPYLLPQKKP